MSELPPRMSEAGERRVDSVVAFARNVLVLVVVVAVLGSLAITAVFNRLGHVEGVAREQTANQEEIQQTQADGRIRTFESRSVNCAALLLSPAMRLPGNCVDKDVLPYVCRTVLQSGGDAWVKRIETQIERPCLFPSS